MPEAQAITATDGTAGIEAVISIELFSCSGGMAEGFRRAGITFTHAFDKDPDACASYEANHGHRPIQIDVRDLVRMVGGGWRMGEIDLLVADPPCTPWSRAGKRLGTADERDMLEETAELIRLLRPRAYLIGNVPGLDDSTQWHVVQRVIGGLAKDGYCVRDYVSLDAADFGVPQHRIRPFWFGHLDGPCIRWPAPTHGDPSKPMALPGMGLRPWVTCREALCHLPLEELGRPVRMKIREPGEFSNGGDASVCSSPDEPARVVVAHEGIKGGGILVKKKKATHTTKPSEPSVPSATTRNTHGNGSVLALNDKHQPAEPDQPAPTMGAKWRGQGAQILRRHDLPQSARTYSADDPAPTVQARDDRAGNGAVTLDWPWNRPSTTVFAEDRIMPPGHQEGSNLSGPNAIILSEKAAAILQGFPPDWKFLGATKKSRWGMLGQAMPPALAEAVARGVLEQILASRREAA